MDATKETVAATWSSRMGRIQIKWKGDRKDGLAGQWTIPCTKEEESTRPLLIPGF